MITCGDIDGKLKQYLEDLLNEEDYQDFHGHLEECSHCKDRVLSIDSFANEIWKLGKVKVPADLCSTVLFKLKQNEGASQAGGSFSFKKWLVGSLILVLAVTALFFAINYFKLRKIIKESVNEMQRPIVTTEIKRKSAGEREAQILYNELKKIARSAGVSEEEISEIENSDETQATGEEPSFINESLEGSETAPLVP